MGSSAAEKLSSRTCHGGSAFTLSGLHAHISMPHEAGRQMFCGWHMPSRTLYVQSCERLASHIGSTSGATSFGNCAVMRAPLHGWPYGRGTAASTATVTASIPRRRAATLRGRGRHFACADPNEHAPNTLRTCDSEIMETVTALFARINYAARLLCEHDPRATRAASSLV